MKYLVLLILVLLTSCTPVVGRVIEVDYSGLSHFSSTEEMELWLEGDDTDRVIILIADEDGKVKFDGQCEDFALQLQERALRDGYIVSFYVMGRLEYREHYKDTLPSGELHALNLAVIGNEVYLIEPQTDKYWLKAYLD